MKWYKELLSMLIFISCIAIISKGDIVTFAAILILLFIFDAWIEIDTKHKRRSFLARWLEK